MKYIVGDFVSPNKKTDKLFDDFDAAYNAMLDIAGNVENYVVGLWADDDDYALYVAINDEVFKSVDN